MPLACTPCHKTLRLHDRISSEMIDLQIDLKEKFISLKLNDIMRH